MTALSEFYEPLRLILGDRDPAGVYEYTDVMLDGAVRSVFRLGRAPTRYSLTGANISPTLPDGNDYAQITYESALLLVGGEETINYRTRAISVTRAGDRKRDLLLELRHRLHQIEEGDGFSTYQNFLIWARSASSAAEMVEVQTHGPLATVDVMASGRRVAL